MQPTFGWWGNANTANNPTTGQGNNCGVTGFTDHAADCETGLVYMQARHYDPVSSRFDSIDPVDFLTDGRTGMVNRYSYTLGDPVNMWDPDGRASTAVAREVAKLGIRQAVKRGAFGLTKSQGAAIIVSMDVAEQGVENILIRVAVGEIINAISDNNDASDPELPEGLVGTQDGKSGKAGKRHVSGPLAPENGGTGDAEEDFETLTGGTGEPVGEDSTYPEGTKIGKNGVTIRPGSGEKGPRIDIPANPETGKPHETLHY